MSENDAKRKYEREQLQWIGPLTQDRIVTIASKAVEKLETILIRDLRANMKQLFNREDFEIKEEDVSLSPFGSAIIGDAFKPVFKQKIPGGETRYWQMACRQTKGPESEYDLNTCTIIDMTKVIKPMIEN